MEENGGESEGEGRLERGEMASRKSEIGRERERRGNTGVEIQEIGLMGDKGGESERRNKKGGKMGKGGKLGRGLSGGKGGGNKEK